MADQQFKFRMVQSGQALDHTPGVAVAAGTIVQKGGLWGFAHVPLPANALGAIEVENVYDGVKDSSVFADGDPVYWVPAGSPVGGTASSGACASAPGTTGVFVGYALAAKLTGDTTVRFRHVINPAAGVGAIDDAITDPGASGAIPVTRSGRVAIVTAAAETRTLAVPAFAGEELLLYMKTDAGDCVITVAAAINQTGNTIITMNDAGDTIRLAAIESGSNLRWRVVSNDGCVLS